MLFLSLTAVIFVITNDEYFSKSKVVLLHSSKVYFERPFLGVFFDHRNLDV